MKSSNRQWKWEDSCLLFRLKPVPYYS
jgi:hypothetical protein